MFGIETTSSTTTSVLLSVTQSLSRMNSQKSDAIIAYLARSYLASRLDQSAGGRAAVLWAVGEYGEDQGGEGVEGLKRWAPDVLRIAAKRFKSEPQSIKLQSLTLASKLLTFSPLYTPILSLAAYIYSLGHIDPSAEVRDRARFFTTLLGGAAVPTLYGKVEDILNLPSKKKAKDRESWDDEDTNDVGHQWNFRVADGGVKLRREQIKLVLLGRQKTLSIPIGSCFILIILSTFH